MEIFAIKLPVSARTHIFSYILFLELITLFITEDSAYIQSKEFLECQTNLKIDFFWDPMLGCDDKSPCKVAALTPVCTFLLKSGL